MNIEEICSKTGSITLTMRDTELRTITNLFCKARSQSDFNKNEYIVNAELFTAITILHHGRIPAFELSLINELYQKGGEGDEKVN